MFLCSSSGVWAELWLLLVLHLVLSPATNVSAQGHAGNLGVTLPAFVNIFSQPDKSPNALYSTATRGHQIQYTPPPPHPPNSPHRDRERSRPSEHVCGLYGQRVPRSSRPFPLQRWSLAVPCATGRNRAVTSGQHEAQKCTRRQCAKRTCPKQSGNVCQVSVHVAADAYALVLSILAIRLLGT